jgi:SAM-dependent methyltransferase
VTLNRIWQIVRNIVTGAEASRRYPARTVEVLRNRIPGIASWRSQALADRSIEKLWNAIPRRVRRWKSTQELGRRIHQRACRVQPRGGGCFTRFFRNVPQLELVRDLVLERPRGEPVKIASVGCSTGAELYSVLWLIRTARPTQDIQALGIDLAEECVQAASRGVYPCRVIEVAKVSENSHKGLFTRDGKTFVVQEWVKEAVNWAVGDACSSDLVSRFGSHDVVFANNFLFHMPPERAEACLRNLARLVARDGYLVVSGADLEVRSRVVVELGFVPVTARWEEIHTAEDVHAAWPLQFMGLEPIDRTRQDCAARYATVFRSAGRMPAVQ